MEQTINPLRALSNQMADAVERVKSALVVVNGRQRQSASGVVYAQDLVLTASHVLERSEGITIQTADKRVLPAQIVGRDSATDLAVLKVSGLGVQPATFSQEEARVGQFVLAVGVTENDGPMASSGIVSTVGGPLQTRSGATIDRYIMTDAIPYPGFSGGPLVDTQGTVIGLLTTGITNGVPLALPISLAITLAEALANHGRIKRGYLGIGSQLIEIPLSQRAGRTQEHGLLIVKVDENSPAQQAGVLIGDILVALDGHQIEDAEDLQKLLVGERVNKTIPLDVIRGNVLQTLQVTVGQRS